MSLLSMMSLINIHFKITFKYGPSPRHFFWLRICGNMLSGIQHYLPIQIFTITNDAQELTHIKVEFKPDTNRIRKGLKPDL
jgi:hypothetical protein